MMSSPETVIRVLPLPVEERADRRDAHPERHERRGEAEVEDGRSSHQLAARLEGVGEERRQQQRAARAEQREHAAEERRE